MKVNVRCVAFHPTVRRVNNNADCGYLFFFEKPVKSELDQDFKIAEPESAALDGKVPVTTSFIFPERTCNNRILSKQNAVYSCKKNSGLRHFPNYSMYNVLRSVAMET